MMASSKVTLGALLGGTILLPSLVAAVPSYACEGLLPKPVEWKPKPGEVKIFQVNERTIRVTVPDNYNQSVPSPMIVAFHDRDQPIEHLEYEGAWYKNKINPDAIMVFPEAEEDRWLGDSTPIEKKTPKNEARTGKEPKTKSKSKSKSKSKKSKDSNLEESEKEEDLKFTSDLLADLENLVCIDTSQIYATGMGTGGGMMHMLACHKELSTKFAAFAAVAGAFGRDKKGIWATCEPGRPQIPIAEIHGMDNRIYPYYLKEGENGKVRTIPPHWIEDWTERNNCGEPTRDPKVSADDDATFVTKLDNGWMTETIGYGGSAIRIARKCFPKNSPKIESKEESKEEETPDQNSQSMPTGPLTDAETLVLHYQIKYFGHGWPRQQLMKQKQVVYNNKMIKPSNETYFDTTKVILDFFKAHRLPEEFARRAEVTAEDPPTEQETSEAKSEAKSKTKSKTKSKIKVQDGEKAKKESPLEEKLRKFQEAQEKIQEVGETTDEKDEL